MQRESSPAYLVLRASARRLLAFIGTVEGQSGGPVVTIWNDQFEAVVGSRRVYLPGLHELSALGLIEARRLPKRHLIGRSDSWRGSRPEQRRERFPSPLVRKAGQHYRQLGSLRCCLSSLRREVLQERAERSPTVRSHDHAQRGASNYRWACGSGADRAIALGLPCFPRRLGWHCGR